MMLTAFFYSNNNLKNTHLKDKDNHSPSREIVTQYSIRGAQVDCSSYFNNPIPSNILKMSHSLCSLSQIHNSTKEKLGAK